ncbi:MAG: GGDEF domain-containing protein [Acidobacteriota bacterium]
MQPSQGENQGAARSEPRARRAAARRTGDSSSARALALGSVPPAVMTLTLLLATGTVLAPGGLLARPAELLAWILIGAVAALHRPLEPPARAAPELAGATLGLGAVVLPAVAVRLGAAPAALTAAALFVVGELARRWLARGLGERRRSGGVTALALVERAALLAAATLVGASSALGLVGGARWLPPLVYGLVLAALVTLGARLHGLDRRAPGRRAGDRERETHRRVAWPWRWAAPVPVDVVGWSLGIVLADLAQSVGWDRVAILWPLVALLVAEAARQALLREHSATRVGDLERLQLAHERILSEASGTAAIAQQILTECRNILPVGWFHFELQRPNGEVESWAAGPDGLLVKGRPKPPARPNALPGIHRRSAWRVIEQPLVRQTAGEDPRRLAMVRLWFDPRRVDADAEELFNTLVPQMASSVDRALLDREAKLDPLTGVPVRRVLEARLQSAFRRSCNDGLPMAVIMCDIDFFKKVNDTHGHAAGDEALKLVAATLDSTRREGDLCCRYGGEEFTVLLEDTDGLAALQLAERLRAAVEDLHLIYEGRHIPLSLSLGVASFPELYIKTPSELLLLADEALYAAKKAGRNRSLLHAGHDDFHELVPS